MATAFMEIRRVGDADTSQVSGDREELVHLLVHECDKSIELRKIFAVTMKILMRKDPVLKKYLDEE